MSSRCTEVTLRLSSIRFPIQHHVWLVVLLEDVWVRTLISHRVKTGCIQTSQIVRTFERKDLVLSRASVKS